MNLLDYLQAKRMAAQGFVPWEPDSRMIGFWQSDRAATLKAMSHNLLWRHFFGPIYEKVLGKLTLKITQTTISTANAAITGWYGCEVIWRSGNSSFLCIRGGSGAERIVKLELLGESLVIDHGHWWCYQEHFRRIPDLA